MGLAASQARFLGITLRKANCEFKSTQLAEQRLQISNQLSDISQEYSNAMNATKLIWDNDMADSVYDLSYSVLMMPSAVNDYNPYFVSTKSGAIILNSKYAQAARAAGIGVGGSMPSEDGRNNFIQALASNGLATAETATTITGTQTSPGVWADGINWSRTTGMGAMPEDKGIMDATDLTGLIQNANIGGASLDWLQMYIKEDATTENANAQAKAVYTESLTAAKNDYLAEGNTTTDLNNLVTQTQTLLTTIVADTVTDANYRTYASGFNGIDSSAVNSIESILKEFKVLEYCIENATDETEKIMYTNQLTRLKQGTTIDNSGAFSDFEKYGVLWSLYQLSKFEANSGSVLSWGDTTTMNWKYYDRKDDTGTTITSTTNEIAMSDVFQTSERKIEEYRNHSSSVKRDGYQMTVVENGVINYNETEIKNMTISDLLLNDIVIMTWNKDNSDANNNKTDAIDEMSYRVSKLMDYIASVFGCGRIGVGLNIDASTDSALTQALAMTKKKFLRSSNAITNGGDWNVSNMGNNSAFNNANEYNRIGSDNDKDVAAVNLSNMVSAFLTYFDNYLRGSESEYNVSRGNKEEDGAYNKTYFVTDDPYYTYMVKTPNQMSNDQKVADFYDELYNNLCAHGWREDGSIDEGEYLEHMVRNGRYQLMALNEDGYFYQTRYAETGYLQEVADEEARTRAEADYTQKKAKLTFKEDEIDIKTKKLDAEIAELNTEINSVQNIISKSIEKTFTMFSS